MRRWAGEWGLCLKRKLSEFGETEDLRVMGVCGLIS